MSILKTNTAWGICWGHKSWILLNSFFIRNSCRTLKWQIYNKPLASKASCVKKPVGPDTKALKPLLGQKCVCYASSYYGKQHTLLRNPRNLDLKRGPLNSFLFCFFHWPLINLLGGVFLLDVCRYEVLFNTESGFSHWVCCCCCYPGWRHRLASRVEKYWRLLAFATAKCKAQFLRL